MSDSTQRFSSRVDDYIKYRPTYPNSIIKLLETECQLAPTSIVADIGSGTGILSKLFLDNGNKVFGVEPNKEMRTAGEVLLKDYANFQSVAATAEATTLPDNSIDVVAAGQALHWFDHEHARREFLRILKPRGYVVLVWNNRRTASSPFLRDYEQLLHSFAIDYQEVNHKHVDNDVLAPFFGGHMRKAVFENSQVFDFDGLRGRLMSSSYAPQSGHPKHNAMLAELERIFHAHEVDGKVRFEYDTEVYYGYLALGSS